MMRFRRDGDRLDGRRSLELERCVLEFVGNLMFD